MIRQSGVPVVENGNLPRRPLDMVVSYSNREASMAMTQFGASRLQEDRLRKPLFRQQRPISRPH
jgi:hypothetical protein